MPRRPLPRHAPLAALALLVALLAGCATVGGRPEAGSGPLAQARVTTTLAPTFTPTLAASATPYPTYTPFPTQTPYPTYTPVPSPTASPRPTTTPVVVAPGVSADWPTTIRQAADAVRGDAAALQAQLANAGAILPGEGRVLAIDLTHDGEEELLVWYVDPTTRQPELRGRLLVLGLVGESWIPLFDPTYGAAISEGARLLTAQDLNADGRMDLAYTLTACGATSCTTQVRVGSWAGSAFRSLTAADIRLPALREALFTDGDGDGRFEMALTSAGNAASGPTRERTDLYGWQGGLYTFRETLYAATDWLPLVVWEAGDALEAGDFAEAALLYGQAASDETLRPWAGGTTDAARAEEERALLRAFSRFRLVVAQAALDDAPAAQSSLDALRSAYPASPFRQAADRFMSRWQGSASLATACRAVAEYAGANAERMVDPLNQFGVSAPRFTAADICPLR